MPSGPGEIVPREIVPGKVVVVDSVTALTLAAAGSVAVAGSHGGRYSAAVAAGFGLRGVILSDAGGGLEEAGLAGLELLQAHAIPAAVVDCWSARIGDGRDLLARGRISFVNAAAARLGCSAGQHCAEAAERLRYAAPHPPVIIRLAEARVLLRPGPVPVWGLDSNSLVRPADAGAIVVTGSHGGLLGGRPESAVKEAVRAAVYNDAGIGIDEAGLGRLPALAARGIAAATVAAATARIGDARSTWQSGIVSAVNRAAATAGARAGITVPAFTDCILAMPDSHA